MFQASIKGLPCMLRYTVGATTAHLLKRYGNPAAQAAFVQHGVRQRAGGQPGRYEAGARAVSERVKPKALPLTSLVAAEWPGRACCGRKGPRGGTGRGPCGSDGVPVLHKESPGTRHGDSLRLVRGRGGAYSDPVSADGAAF